MMMGALQGYEAHEPNSPFGQKDFFLAAKARLAASKGQKTRTSDIYIYIYVWLLLYYIYIYDYIYIYIYIIYIYIYILCYPSSNTKAMVYFLVPFDPMCGAFGSSIIHISLLSNIHMWYPYHVYRQINTICPNICLMFWGLPIESIHIFIHESFDCVATSIGHFPIAWRSSSRGGNIGRMVWMASPVSRDWQASVASVANGQHGSQRQWVECHIFSECLVLIKHDSKHKPTGSTKTLNHMDNIWIQPLVDQWTMNHWRMGWTSFAT